MNDVKPTGEPLLTMESVAVGSFHHPQTTVIEEVDWQVRRGEFWVVVGHHGAGKSDLLMTAAGLMGPVRGACTLFGQRMPGFERDALAARLRTGLVFNDARLLNHLTLGGNVQLPMGYHHAMDEDETTEYVLPLLEATGLTGVAELTPGQVGPPWRLRTALARALAMGPELLLLDEPLTGLDTRHASWWIEFLRNLHAGLILPRTDDRSDIDWLMTDTSTASAVTAGLDPGFRTPRFSSPRCVTVVVASGTVDPWCDLATHCAVLEAGRLSVRGGMRQAVANGDAQLREFSGFAPPAFDRSPSI